MSVHFSLLLLRRRENGDIQIILDRTAADGENAAMPRTARAAVGGYCSHVLNRGNGRAPVFHEDDDYAAFGKLLRLASARVPMRLLAYCLMPNHFHLVLWPPGDADLSAWMQRLLTTHVRRYHKKYRSTGHLWQGRFKAFPIAQDGHLLAVLRHVERNPLRAGLVSRAEDWPWSSLRWWRLVAALPWLNTGPVPRPADWPAYVNAPQTEGELEAVRRSVRRGRPYGSDPWAAAAAAQLGLESSLRPRGRPPRIAPIQPSADLFAEK